MSVDLFEAPARISTNKRLAAVIDIGSTSIRMALAHIDDQGDVALYDHFSQGVHLGRDTFTKGIIEKGTIEECVRVLKTYQRVLDELNIRKTDDIRIVATSAVREAINRLSFLDRVYTATNMQVTPLDEAEVNRITYLGIQPLLKQDPSLAVANTVITEVGGGSTEMLLVSRGDVQSSHTYRLGSLRLRETLDAYRAPRATVRSIMETQIRRVVEQIRQQTNAGKIDRVIGLGGDLRFAAKELLPEWSQEGLAGIPIGRLEKLANSVLDLSEDRLVHKYHISFHDAGTLGPALLAYVQLVKAFNQSELIVSSVNLRDGLLKEMALKGTWNSDFANQVIRSAYELGKKFHFAEDHARHVAKLCRILFQGLRDEHQLEPRFELLLQVAAWLHEIGLYVGTGGYHKHTMYLIQNSELFGLSRVDVKLIALTARYHRKTSPKPIHTPFTALDRDQRIAVVKMAAILRVADALDASHSQRLHELHFTREGNRLIISIPQVDDLSLEQLALKQTAGLFEETFGVPVLLRKMRS